MLDPRRVLADQVWRDEALDGYCHLGAAMGSTDAGDALIRFHLDDDHEDVGLHAAACPRRLEGSRQRQIDHAISDAGYFHL